MIFASAKRQVSFKHRDIKMYFVVVWRLRIKQQSYLTVSKTLLFQFQKDPNQALNQMFVLETTLNN